MEQDLDMIQYYRRVAAKLPKGGPLAERAKATWKVSHPRLYEELSANGILDDAANVAAEHYREDLARMVEEGANYYDAAEVASNDWFNLEPPPEPSPEEDELGEENQIAAFESWLRSLDNKDDPEA